MAKSCGVADVSRRDAAVAGQAADPGQRVRLGEDEGRLALVVDGVVQSISVDGPGPIEGYWWEMVPDVRPRRALILGLGAGTVARLLVQRFGAVPIVGVERDPVVVALARAHFGLDLPNLEIVVGDAFAYVAECRLSFDLICVDLYDGLTLARGALAKPFLRQVKALLTPSGTALFNLALTRRLPQQMHRLAQVFQVTRAVDVGLNVVVHCKAR